jgi:hypothetical protein
VLISYTGFAIGFLLLPLRRLFQDACLPRAMIAESLNKSKPKRRISGYYWYNELYLSLTSLFDST